MTTPITPEYLMQQVGLPLITSDGKHQTRLQQLRDALLDSAALDSLPAPDPLIGGILMRDSLAWLYGKWGSFKSLLAIDWASCVSTGLPWQMHEVKQVPVLYVMAEGSYGLQPRVRAWESASKTTSRITFLPVAIQIMNDMDLLAVQQIAADMHAGLIVIDTQARCTVGKDENSAVDMGQLVDRLDKLRASTSACILTVHHEPRQGENLRGSTAMEGAAESMFRCVRDGTQLTVECKKQKDDEEEPPITLWLQKVQQSVILTSQAVTATQDRLTESDRQILTEMADGFGSNEVPASTLLKISKLSERTFWRSLKHLVDAGQVIKTGTDNRPRYKLPDPDTANTANAAKIN